MERATVTIHHRNYKCTAYVNRLLCACLVGLFGLYAQAPLERPAKQSVSDLGQKAIRRLILGKGFAVRTFGVLPFVQPLATSPDTWLGGPGSWGNGLQWSTGAPPGPSNNVFINNSTPAAVVQGPSVATINNLTVGSTSTLNLWGSLTINGNSISNAGTIAMSGGDAAYLTIAGSNVILSGGGTLTMTTVYDAFGGTDQIITGAAPTDTLTNQEVIQGSGLIGGLALVNSGTINANQSPWALTVGPSSLTNKHGATLEATNGGTLILQPVGAATNGGTIQAAGGSTVEMIGGTYANTGGTIQDAAGNLQLSNVTINGGTVAQTGAGTIQLSGATINAPLTNSSTGTIEVLDILDAGPSSTTGALTNPAGGQVTVNSGASLTLTGNVNNMGTITVDGTYSDAYLTVGASNVTLTGGGTLTMSSGITCCGFSYGVITGVASTDTLTNQETIQGAGFIGEGSMNLVNSGTINANQSIPLTVNPNNLTNNRGGVLEATNGGTLILQPAGAATNAGTIQAASGSTVEMIGGTYTNTGASIQDAAGNLQFSGVTINGGTVAQTGAGSMLLVNATFNAPLTNSSTGTIEVSGPIFNYGPVSTIEALNNPAGGQVNIDSGASLILNGAVSNAGAIAMNAVYADAYLTVGASNLTLSGGGTLTMSGGVSCSPGCSNTYSIITGAASTDTLTNQETIQGSGYVGDGSMNLVNSGTINANQGIPLTVNPNNLTNNRGGVLEATNGGTLILQPAGAATNAGTIQAASGSTVEMIGGTYTNTGGIIQDAAGALQFSGVTINGGTVAQTGAGSMLLVNATLNAPLTNSSTGTIEVSGPIFNYGPVSTIGALNNPAGGQVNIDSGASLILNGAVSNAGAIAMNAGYADAYFTVGASNLTLSGGGTLTMSGGLACSPGCRNTYSIITGAASTDTLTNQETIQGAGYIGESSMNLVNFGTIDANQGAPLTVNPNSLANNRGGILEATNGGTLILQPSGTGANAGTIQAASGSTVEMIGGTYTNTGGTIQDTAGDLQFTGVTVNGGTVTQTGAGSIQLSSATLDAPLTNSSTGTIEVLGYTSGSTIGALSNPTGGQVAIDSDASLTLTGAASNAGTVTVGTGATLTLSSTSANSNSGTIAVNGTLGTMGSLTLSGAGDITLTGGSLTALGANETLNIAKTSTVQGSGYVSNFGINNAGTLSSNQGLLIIFPNAAGLSNTGSISVSAGDIMQIGTSAGGALTNFSSSTNTLTGGTYKISGALQFGASGTTIATNAANITLNGTGQMIDFGNNNILAGFNNNAATGVFKLASGASLTTTGGSFANAGSFTVSAGTTFTVGGSSFNFTQTGGTAMVNGTLTSTTLGTLAVNGGTLDGTGTLGYNVVDASILTPGDSATVTGRLTVADTYTQQSTGALDIQINGATAGTKYDLLKVNQGATLGGTLNIALGSGFTPTVGETFTILTASSVTGAFATVNGIAINGSEYFKVTYNHGSVVLTVESGTPSASSPASSALASRLIPAPVHRGSGVSVKGRYGLGVFGQRIAPLPVIAPALSIARTPVAFGRPPAGMGPLPLSRGFSMARTPVALSVSFLMPATGMHGFRPMDQFGSGALASAPASTGDAGAAGYYGISSSSAASYNSMGTMNHMRFECGADLKALLKTSRKQLLKGLWAAPDSPDALYLGYMSYTGSH